MKLDGYTYTAYLTNEVRDAWSIDTKGVACLGSFSASRLKGIIEKAKMPIDSQAIERALQPLVEQLTTISDAWKQTYRELEQLDQLFIAV